MRGGCSGRPATPGTCSLQRAKRTSTLEPERPRSDLAARSPSQPAVGSPLMATTCARARAQPGPSAAGRGRSPCPLTLHYLTLFPSIQRSATRRATCAAPCVSAPQPSRARAVPCRPGAAGRPPWPAAVPSCQSPQNGVGRQGRGVAWWAGTRLVAGQNAGAVRGPAQDGRDHQQAPVARADQQAHALHLAVAGHAEVCILPAPDATRRSVLQPAYPLPPPPVGPSTCPAPRGRARTWEHCRLPAWDLLCSG